jgi:hypothetical protein
MQTQPRHNHRSPQSLHHLHLVVQQRKKCNGLILPMPTQQMLPMMGIHAILAENMSLVDMSRSLIKIPRRPKRVPTKNKLTVATKNKRTVARFLVSHHQRNLIVDKNKLTVATKNKRTVATKNKQTVATKNKQTVAKILVTKKIQTWTDTHTNITLLAPTSLQA